MVCAAAVGSAPVLLPTARDRVARLEVPMTTGVPFVVCVGDERIYGGAFWVSWSSMSFQGIVIDTLFAKMDGHPIRIQLGYPESPERFEGKTCDLIPGYCGHLRVQVSCSELASSFLAV